MIQPQTLGAVQGFINVDHTVPEDCMVFEIKSCELCMRPFMRPRLATVPFYVQDFESDGRVNNAYAWIRKELRRDKNVRYCWSCKAKALETPDDATYREALVPELKKMHRSNPLPKYDETLPKRQQPICRRFGKLGDWRSRLLIVFAQQGAMTYRDIRAVTGHRTTGTLSVALLSFPQRLKHVGSIYPKPYRGKAAGLYLPEMMVGVSQ